MKTSGRSLGQVRRTMLVTTALATASSVLLLGMPVGALLLLDHSAPAGANDLALLIVAGLAFVLTAAAIIDACREVILIRAGFWLDHVIGRQIIESAIGRGTEGTAGRHDLTSLADAVAALRAALTGGRLSAVAEVPAVVIACGIVAWIDVRLGVACAGVIALAALVVAIAGRASASLSSAANRHGGDARQWTATLAATPSLLETHGIGRGALRHWEMLNRGHVALGYRAALRIGLGRVAVRTLAGGGATGLLAAGVILATSGSITIGAAVAAMLVTARALSVVDNLSANWDAIRSARCALKTLADAERTLAKPPLSARSAGGGPLVLSGVTVQHSGATAPSLQGIDLTLHPGAVVAVVGGAGSGKSTLAALAAGTLSPDHGRAEVDGIAIQAAQRAEAGAPIGYLSDDPRLAAGRLSQNITAFLPRAEAAAVDAAVLCGVHPLIASLPAGYETEAGADGRFVSLRTRRAVALARAVCGPRRFVVLDTPEAGLDDDGITRLERLIGQLRLAGIGVLVATGEARLVRIADEVVLLDGGRIEAKLPAARFIDAASQISRAERTWPRVAA